MYDTTQIMSKRLQPKETTGSFEVFELYKIEFARSLLQVILGQYTGKTQYFLSRRACEDYILKLQLNPSKTSVFRKSICKAVLKDPYGNFYLLGESIKPKDQD